MVENNGVGLSNIEAKKNKRDKIDENPSRLSKKKQVNRNIVD